MLYQFTNDKTIKTYFLFKIIMIADSWLCEIKLLVRFVDNTFCTEFEPTVRP